MLRAFFANLVNGPLEITQLKLVIAFETINYI